MPPKKAAPKAAGANGGARSTTTTTNKSAATEPATNARRSSRISTKTAELASAAKSTTAGTTSASTARNKSAATTAFSAASDKASTASTSTRASRFKTAVDTSSAAASKNKTGGGGGGGGAAGGKAAASKSSRATGSTTSSAAKTKAGGSSQATKSSASAQSPASRKKTTVEVVIYRKNASGASTNNDKQVIDLSGDGGNKMASDAGTKRKAAEADAEGGAADAGAGAGTAGKRSRVAVEAKKAASPAKGRKGKVTESKETIKLDIFAQVSGLTEMAGEDIGMDEIVASFTFNKIALEGPGYLAFAYKVYEHNAGKFLSLPRGKVQAELAAHGVTNDPQFRSYLNKLIRQLIPKGPPNANPHFEPFYKWVFQHVKGADKKVISLEEATAYLTGILDVKKYDVKWRAPPEGQEEKLPGLGEGEWPHLGPFITFLDQQTSIKCLNKDQWESFLPFNVAVKANLEGYDELGGAWPYIYDEYVEWLKKTYPDLAVKASDETAVDDDAWMNN